MRCPTPVIVNPVDSDAILAASSFTPKNGLAKAYFVGGKWGTAVSIVMAKQGGATRLIDGNQVEQIDKNDVMAFEIAQRHTIFLGSTPLVIQK